MKNHIEEIKKVINPAFKYTIPVFTGYLILGMAYGVLMRTNGCAIIWPILMSVFVYAGSAQFAAIPLFASLFNPIQAFVLALMINVRHLFYGISMLKKYSGTGKIKPYLIYAMTDETFSVVSSAEVPQNADKRYFYGVISVLNHFYWVLGTALGAIFGSFIKFNTEGLDFSLTALFVVLFLEQIKDRTGRIAGVVGLLSTFVCLCVFGPDNVVFSSMAVIILILCLGRKKLCN